MSIEVKDNLLVGGSGNSCALQLLSVEAQSGVKLIGGGAADDARDGFREGLNPSYGASAAKAPRNVSPSGNDKIDSFSRSQLSSAQLSSAQLSSAQLSSVERHGRVLCSLVPHARPRRVSHLL